MKRRSFLRVLAGSVVPSPLFARAQSAPSGSVPKRIVWLDGQGSSPERDAAQKRIREGFRARGIREGEHITLTFQALPPDNLKQSDEVADSLIRGRPDAIVLMASALLWSLKKRTPDIPVVFYNLARNPVDEGIVESLARPGVNITGSTQMFDDAVLKDMQLFKQLVPPLERLGVLTDKAQIEEALKVDPGLIARQRERWKRQKAALGIDIVELPISLEASREEIASTVKDAHVQAVSIDYLTPEAEQYVRTAPVPAKCFGFANVRKGCVFGWSFEWREGEAYAVQAVQRILNGENPAVIPVYQTPIAFALNRRRARELGIEVPAGVLISARQVYD